MFGGASAPPAPLFHDHVRSCMMHQWYANNTEHRTPTPVPLHMYGDERQSPQPPNGKRTHHIDYWTIEDSRKAVNPPRRLLTSSYKSYFHTETPKGTHVKQTQEYTQSGRHHHSITSSSLPSLLVVVVPQRLSPAPLFDERVRS